MMKVLIWAVLATSLAAVVYATPAVAATQKRFMIADPTEPEDFQIGSSVMFEHDDPVEKVLIIAQYNGFDVKTGEPTVVRKYFQVSAQLELSTASTGPLLDAFSVNIVPISRVREVVKDEQFALRGIPIEIRRDLGMGYGYSLAVQAIGWSYQNETPVGKSGEKFTKFAQIMVDILGLKLAGILDRGTFVGGQLAVVQAQAGLNWNVTKGTSIRLSVNGSNRAELGRQEGSAKPVLMNEIDLYARISYILKYQYYNLTAYADGGFTSFTRGEWNEDAQYKRRHFYLIIGANITF